MGNFFGSRKPEIKPGSAGVSEYGTPNIMSKAKAETVNIGEIKISNELQEVVGSTSWEELFS